LRGAVGKHFAIPFLFLALLTALYGVYVDNTRITEALLAGILFWSIGWQGIMAGFAHWYRPMADKIAEKIGWKPGSPFQKEVAAADAAFGVLGVASWWLRGDFWIATTVGAAMMLFIMGIGHVLDLRRNRNTSIYNAGSVLYFDLLVPLVMVVLLILWKLGY